jgi:hypothetical protein
VRQSDELLMLVARLRRFGVPVWIDVERGKVALGDPPPLPPEPDPPGSALEDLKSQIRWQKVVADYCGVRLSEFPAWWASLPVEYANALVETIRESRERLAEEGE